MWFLDVMCILYASKVLINKVKCLISEVDRQAYVCVKHGQVLSPYYPSLAARVGARLVHLGPLFCLYVCAQRFVSPTIYRLCYCAKMVLLAFGSLSFYPTSRALTRGRESA